MKKVFILLSVIAMAFSCHSPELPVATKTEGMVLKLIDKTEHCRLYEIENSSKTAWFCECDQGYHCSL